MMNDTVVCQLMYLGVEYSNGLTDFVIVRLTIRLTDQCFYWLSYALVTDLMLFDIFFRYGRGE